MVERYCLYKWDRPSLSSKKSDTKSHKCQCMNGILPFLLELGNIPLNNTPSTVLPVELQFKSPV
jgi:hypothetical protein